MNKPKRTITLDSFVIKKSKNILTGDLDSDVNQHEELSENVVPNTDVVNVHQHINNNNNNNNNNNINEITTPLVHPEINRLSIENTDCSSTNPSTSNENCSFGSPICCQNDNTENIDTNSQTSMNNYCERTKKNSNGSDTVVSKSILRCEKLISDLLSLKKASENIDVLLTMLKSTNNSKELCARETYAFSDVILKIVSDLRLNCETYLTECVNNRPLVSDSLEIRLERDPGGYVTSPRFNNDQLKHLITLGPYQPRLSTYPKLKTKKNERDETGLKLDSGKTTCFQVRWYDEYPLVEYSILKDRIFCFACRLFGHGPGALCADPAWTTNGLQQWTKMTGKDGKFIKHFQSNAHISAHGRLKMFNNEDSHIDIQLDKELIYVRHRQQDLCKLNRYVFLSLLDATKFLARQTLSFRAEVESEGNFNQTVLFLRRHNKMLDQWYKDSTTRNHHVTYLSNRAQNEFISVIGNAVHDSIINRVNKSLFWSTMVDTTPDVSHKDIMSIIVRFVNEDGEVEERLLYIGEIKGKTGRNIAENMLEIFSKFGLDINKLIGQSYDGGMNLKGIYKGVQAVVSELLGLEILFIPCCPHRSNKVVEHATQNSLEAKKFFDLSDKLYVFLMGSTKRFIVLRDVYSMSTNENTLSLKNSTDTRWSSQFNNIIAIYKSFDEIIQALDELSNDEDSVTKLEASGIRRKTVSYEFYCVLLFIKHLMSMTNALTTALQDEDLDILLTIDILTKTIYLLNQIRMDEDTLNKLLELTKERMKNFGVDADDEFEGKHRRRLKSLRIDPNAGNESIFMREQYYRTTFYRIIDQLSNEYNDLLQTLEEKLKHFICLCPSKINSFKLEDADQIKSIVTCIGSNELLYYDVQLLMENLQECSSIKDVMIMFSKNNYKSIHPRLFRVYSYILTLPVTIASNERSFSRLKLIKTYLRSRMLDDRLMDLILCSSEKDILDSLNLDELVVVWGNKKERLLQI